MKKINTIILSFVTILTLFISQLSFATQTEDIAKHISLAINHLAKGNIDKFINAWADDASIAMVDSSSLRVLSGRDEIMKYMQEEVNPKNIQVFEIKNGQVKQNDRFYWFTCDLEMKIKDENGRVITKHSKGVYLMMKDKEDWKILQVISPFIFFKR